MNMMPSTSSFTSLSFARRLADARRMLGYSLDDVAETSGFTVEEIALLEAGSDGDARRMRRVAAVLRIPVADLFVQP